MIWVHTGALVASNDGAPRQAVGVHLAGAGVGAAHLEERCVRGVVQRLVLPDALVLLGKAGHLLHTPDLPWDVMASSCARHKTCAGGADAYTTSEVSLCSAVGVRCNMLLHGTRRAAFSNTHAPAGR